MKLDIMGIIRQEELLKRRRGYLPEGPKTQWEKRRSYINEALFQDYPILTDRYRSPLDRRNPIIFRDANPLSRIRMLLGYRL